MSFEELASLPVVESARINATGGPSLRSRAERLLMN
jgi:hypothetical protein